MKFIALFFILFSTCAFAEWKYITTDASKDCVEISSATEDAPIDFYEAECKSFGGYKLSIKGSDLRYGPSLFYEDTKIDMKPPFHFHDLSSNELEWLYTLEKDNEGLGKLEWKGFIYQLSVATDDGEKDSQIYYSVSLKGEKSCVLGTSMSKEEARLLVMKSNGACSYEGGLF